MKRKKRQGESGNTNYIDNAGRTGEINKLNERSNKNVNKSKVKITKKAIEFILSAAKHVHPKEFIGLLREQNGVIYEIVILPLSTYGKRFSSLRLDMLPAGEHPLGTVHSHPSMHATPSRQDLLFFSRFGRVHAIVAYPYDIQSLVFYNNQGQYLDFTIVD